MYHLFLYTLIRELEINQTCIVSVVNRHAWSHFHLVGLNVLQTYSDNENTLNTNTYDIIHALKGDNTKKKKMEKKIGN